MDAFFASVEQRDHMEWRGKPIAVGGGEKGGVVSAASYEARAFGVRSAMPGALAKQKCPHLIFVPHRFDMYQAVSDQIKKIFYQYTDLVEPLSLDEAYLDVSENKFDEASAIKIAREIKAKILTETELTASAGVSVNKFLAKVASDIHKPNGLTVILPEQVIPFVQQLKIEKFFGIGTKTADRMKRMGIHKGHDLEGYTKLELAQQFGKLGLYLYDVIRGVDHRPVVAHRPRKSISKEYTYVPNLTAKSEITQAVESIIERIFLSCAKHHISGRTLQLKLRYHDFTTLTRSVTATHPYQERDMIRQATWQILNGLDLTRPIRLLGIGLTNLELPGTAIQLELPFDIEE